MNPEALVLAMGKDGGADDPDGSDDSPTAPMGGGGESGGGMVVQVPLDALSQPDDQDQMQTPEDGDPVNFSVDGVLVGVQGNMASVKVSAVNGVEVGKDAGEQPPTEEDAINQMGDQLRQQSQGMSGQQMLGGGQ